MFTSGKQNGNRAVSAVIAAAIVGINGLALDRGHLVGAPAGIVEIGELTPVDTLPRIAMLPEVVVTATSLAGIEAAGTRA